MSDKDRMIDYVCTNPDECEEEHNEITGWEWEEGRAHHLGCPCSDCMLYYYLHLK